MEKSMGKVLFDKMAAIDNGVANGTIATPEQLDRIFKENSEAILKEVPALSNFAVQQMSDLTNNFMNTQKELRATQATFDQNAQKISPVS
jgi:3-polyprenyl-4-hydroxybenzoate decarboxylase